MARLRAAAAAMLLVVSFPAWATVSTTTSVVEYTCNGSTKVYAVPFKFLASADLQVSRVLVAAPNTATSLVLTTDYTVSGAGAESGGQVVLSSPATSCASSLYKLRIRRATTRTQATKFSAYSAFPAKAVEQLADRLVMQFQEAAEGSAITSGFDFTGPSGNAALVTATGSSVGRRLDVRAADVANAADWGASPAASGADNVAAFNAAASAASSTAVLTAPAGTYQLAGTIALPSGVTFRAPGVVLQQTSANTPHVKSSDVTDFHVDGVTFAGVGRTDSNSTLNSAFWGDEPSTKSFGIWCKRCQRVRVENCKFSNIRGAAIHLREPWDVWIEKNQISGTYDGGVLETGLPPANASYSQFGVYLYSDTADGTAHGGRILVRGNVITNVAHAVFAAPGMDYLTIEGNYWQDLQQHGFYVYPHKNLTITKNRGHSITGCKVQLLPSNTKLVPTDISIVDNRLSSDSAPALMLEAEDEIAGSTTVRASIYSEGALISDNTLSSTAHAGLFLSSARAVKVTNNTIRDTARNGIFSWASSGLIASNTISRTGATSYAPIAVNASPYMTMTVRGNEIHGIGAVGADSYLDSQWNATYSPPIAWAGSKYHALGAYVQNGGNVYVATTGGTSAASGGPTGTGTGITDGSVVWNYVIDVANVDRGTTVLAQNRIIPGPVEPTYATRLASTNVELYGNRFAASTKLVRHDTVTSLVDNGDNQFAGWNAGTPYSGLAGAGRPHRDFYGTNYAGQTGGPSGSIAYKAGDRIWNTAPTAGGTDHWVCTTSGSPGTWKVVAIQP